MVLSTKSKDEGARGVACSGLIRLGDVSGGFFTRISVTGDTRIPTVKNGHPRSFVDAIVEPIRAPVPCLLITPPSLAFRAGYTPRSQT